MESGIQTSATLTIANFGIGSFIEFIPMMSILRERYTPETLPYHFVVPSLPGYTFSSPQPLDQDFSPVEAARVMNTLAKDLGFGDGYLVQGGDVGSRVARNMGVAFDTCKGISSMA
jgi:microsomal epoxide hydrolase